MRILSADVPGKFPLQRGLTRIKGIGPSLSHALCVRLNLDPEKKIHSLSNEEIKKLEEQLKSMEGVDSWMLNRRRDYDSGEDQHLLTTDIKFRTSFDIKRLQKIKSYRGLRHAAGLPVRGQRTKAHFRKGKALGVKRKKGGKK